MLLFRVRGDDHRGVDVGEDVVPQFVRGNSGDHRAVRDTHYESDPIHDEEGFAGAFGSRLIDRFAYLSHFFAAEFDAPLAHAFGGVAGESDVSPALKLLAKYGSEGLLGLTRCAANLGPRRRLGDAFEAYGIHHVVPPLLAGLGAGFGNAVRGLGTDSEHTGHGHQLSVDAQYDNAAFERYGFDEACGEFAVRGDPLDVAPE